MKIDLKDPPRAFAVGVDGRIVLNHVGDVHLASNEQLTFVTDNGANFDFVRKEWGFYATPSINSRLVQEGFKTALVRNEGGRIYVMVVEDIMMLEFEKYCRIEGQRVLCWLNEYSRKD